MIRHRRDAGRLYRREWGVYSPTVSHNAAAAVWDIGPWPTGKAHVTAPSMRARGSHVVLHRAKVERVVRDGFPLTTVARTLADLGSLLSLQRLEIAFDRAERLGLLDTKAVTIFRSPRRT